MKNKQRNLDVVHHGLVLISDGNGRGRPSRLCLTKDQLSVQIPNDGSATSEGTEPATPEENATRTVTIRRDGGGLGLSIKGGTENRHNLPIVISKIFPGMPADQTGQLFVGDAIVEVNGMPVEGRSHDEVVEMLKSEGEELRLGVRHYTHIAPYLKPAQSLQPGRSGSAFEKLYEPNTWKSAMKAQSDLGLYDGEKPQESKDDKWKTITTIPLPMAYVTRYLWGTDNIRPNSFEVRSVDGTSSGIVHCEDARTLDQWIAHINNHIQSLNNKSVKMSNKYLHQSEQITYIGWVNEHMEDDLSENPKHKWEPRFLILKGGDVCLFESPPLNSDDLNKCIYLYKCYDVALKQVPNDSRRLDKRENCCYIETCMPDGIRHYLSFETSQMMEQFETVYHKCVYNTVTNMQTRTFACSYEGRPCGLVLDIKQGISLYDIPTKSYTWQYRFRDLHSSSDDGKIHVQLVFKDDRALTGDNLETKDIECDEVLAITFNLHSFLITKILAADPDFLKQNPLL